jgi:hypothetical protein
LGLLYIYIYYIYIFIWKYHKETPCEATFISNKLKCHVFSFSLFSSTKSENQREGGTDPAWGRAGTSEMGEEAGKGGRRVNTVQKCVHMYVNAKMIQ